ncbi:hypothetical protein LZ30DRAFT_725090 [Colletotrichum cereale]|nr:hypothetical protein LZ30DRAFT_725090 [Colletotrichum cereale]
MEMSYGVDSLTNSMATNARPCHNEVHYIPRSSLQSLSFSLFLRTSPEDLNLPCLRTTSGRGLDGMLTRGLNQCGQAQGSVVCHRGQHTIVGFSTQIAPKRRFLFVTEGEGYETHPTVHCRRTRRSLVAMYRSQKAEDCHGRRGLWCPGW